MRERLLFISAIILFVASVPIVYFMLFEHGLSVSGTGQAAPLVPTGFKAKLLPEIKPQSAPMALSLNQLQGRVEVARGDGRNWSQAEEGMVLQSQDRIRTGNSSSATLSMPGVFTVRMDSDSEFLVQSLTENLFRFLLAEGMIDASVVPAKTHSIEVAAARAVARSRGGQFKMHADKSGMVAVGTSKGRVELESEGKIVRIDAGYMARVKQGNPPEDPIRIPKKLLLKVRWPKERNLSSGRLVVKGRSHPGARVKIAGVVVEVDPKGRFRQVLRLGDGKHRVAIYAQDVGNNSKEIRSHSFTVDTRADSFQIKTSPEMWRDKKP